MSFLSALLFSVGGVIPVFDMAAFFCPVPLALLGARENDAWATVGLALTSFFLILLFGPSVALYFLLGEGILCLGLTLPLGRAEKGSECLLLCTGVSIVSKILFLLVALQLSGENPFLMGVEAMETFFAQMFTEINGASDDAALRESLSRMAESVPYITPSLIVLSSMFDSFLNYKLCERLQRKWLLTQSQNSPQSDALQAAEHPRGMGRAFPPLPSFEAWRFPKSLLLALLFAVLLPFLSEEDDLLAKTMETNLKFIVCVFLFLQGLSLAWWAFAKRSWPLVVRVALIVLLFFPIFGLWAIGFGFVDICLDFRNRTLNQKFRKK
jgi:uncharacterized protein YybS (DUF2232 family)